MKLVRYVNIGLNSDLSRPCPSDARWDLRTSFLALPELSANHSTRFLMKCANETVTIELKNGMFGQPTPRGLDLTAIRDASKLPPTANLKGARFADVKAFM